MTRILISKTILNGHKRTLNRSILYNRATQCSMAS